MIIISNTEWQEEEDKRFYSNVETVRKIAEKFGLQLRAFNPDWGFESTPLTPLYNISDDFMGKTAVSFGYKWNFNNDIYKEITKHEEWIKQLNSRLIDKNKEEKIILEIIENLGDEHTDEIFRLLKSNAKYEKKSLFEAKKRLDILNKVIEIRNNLSENL